MEVEEEEEDGEQRKNEQDNKYSKIVGLLQIQMQSWPGAWHVKLRQLSGK